MAEREAARPSDRDPRASGGDNGAGGGAPLDRLLRWQVVLPLLALVLVLTVLFTPATDRPGDARLTTRSTEPQGAQALFEIAHRLGWRTERRDVGFSVGQLRLAGRDSRDPAARPAAAVDSVAAAARAAAAVRLDTTATYAVLDPPTDLTPAEAGALLDAVRRGASLLVVLGQGAILGDSLHIQPSQQGAAQADSSPPDVAAERACAGDRDGGEGLINWPTGRIHSYWLVPRAPLPRDTVTFASVALTRSQIRARRRAAEKRAADARQRAASDSALTAATRLATPPGAYVDTTRDTTRGSTRDSTRAGGATDDDIDELDSAATAVEDSAALARPAEDTAIAAETTDGDGGARVDVSRREPAALGYPLGAGRVVVVADPDWLRNDVIRICRWNAGVAAVRMLEYLGRGRPAGGRLVFDEFHQGFGRHPSTLRAIRRALTESVPGRALAQALVAALLLLAAVGARALAPRSTARLERRSPLEHVGALSRAYAQVGASRLATRRLVRGVRRRHGAGAAARFVRGAAAGGEAADEQFLDAVAARYPGVAGDAALVREALRSPRTPAQFLEVGRAVERIEDAVVGRAPAPVR